MDKMQAQLEKLAKLLPEPLGLQVAPHARLVSLRANQIVIGHQDQTNDVFVVLEGAMRVELHSLNGREIILADLGPGELIGEFAALDDQPRSASVMATRPSLLASIPGDTFRKAALAQPETAEWLARRLVRRIRELTQRIYELNALAVRDRLHCELLRLCIAAGVTENRAMIEPAPTHVQLAGRIGSHREAVTRELLWLQKQGIVIKHGRALQIEDVERLAEIVRAATGHGEAIERARLG